MDRLGAIPGVTAAAIITAVPLVDAVEALQLPVREKGVEDE